MLDANVLALFQVTVVMKFGGSSVSKASRMREVADIICSFPEHLPCIVLSAMGQVSPIEHLERATASSSRSTIW